jgi:soluble lytic murein transglycosylase
MPDKIKTKTLKNCLLRIIISITILLIISSISISTFCGCKTIKNITKKQVEETKKADEKGSEIQQGESTSNTGSATATTREVETTDSTAADTSASESSIDTTSSDTTQSGATETTVQENSVTDISVARKYFTEGIKNFEEGSYVTAEYYLGKIKDSYKILSDHTLYYLAKSLLMQKKYDLAEKYYSDLKNNYPDSIFNEKATLEFADLFFLQQNYITAEEQYSNFINKFASSDLAPYCLFQLAICQENNSKYTDALENYKKIWLNYPANEYSDTAYTNISSLAEKKLVEPFIPTNDQIYKRGEILFNLYLYESAIKEFNQILENGKKSALGAELHGKTLFKLGMCNFNLRDYTTATDYLIKCYESFPSGSYADDSLYYLGRAFTSLNQEDNSLQYYQKLLKNFPQSNYADDSLYRIGRIYFLRDDLDSAAANYNKIIEGYPNGDKIPDALWELGWIQYRRGDYNSAKSTFANMAARFKGTQLGEKANFWQAKSCQKLGENENAVNIFKEIINSKSYTYYTFASKEELANLDVKIEIPPIDKSAYPDNPKIDQILPEIYNDLENSNANSSDPGTKFTHIDKAKELLSLEFYTSTAKEIEAGNKEFEENNIKILEISTLFFKAQDYIDSQKLIVKYYSKLNSNLNSPYKDYLYYLLYPFGFKEFIDKYSSQFGVDPLFVLAVIREESRFQPDAGSYAGALGLMQIIPKTGKGIASQLGIANFSNSMLLDPETSIKMGAYYLSKQLESFNQNKYYASGAYNGGPGAMNKWISKWGDKDMDEFIEYMPYEETRNYIRKVMGSYFFYQMLYQ